MVRIGVVGYGDWGPNLVRNFYETPGAEVVCVADRRPERRNFYEDETPPAAVITVVSATHPQVKKTIDELFVEREERSPLEDEAVAARQEVRGLALIGSSRLDPIVRTNGDIKRLFAVSVEVPD